MDESRRREDALDRELSRELTRAFRAQPVAPPAADHLDGEMAAAWMEQGLDAGARARAEAHLADCGQCQALIATLSRISPPREPAVPSWRQWLRTPWLVPAAAAAVAVAVWVAVPSQRPSERPSQNPTAAPESIQARLEDRSSPPPTSAAAPATLAAPAAAPAPAEARSTPEPGARRAAKAEQDSSESKASESTQFARVAPQAASPAQDLRKSTLAADSPAPARERQEATGALAGAAAAAPAAPPPAPAAVANGAPTQEAARTAAAPAAEARADQAQARNAFTTASRLVVMTPDGTGRWRIAAGRIQYAARNGSPWISAAALDSSGLTAGAAPGGLVCWFVGRAGTVLLTTDAVRFSRVAAPAATDLIAVRATDARTATVTASDGRRFSTTDQGASWTLVAGSAR